MKGKRTKKETQRIIMEIKLNKKVMEELESSKKLLKALKESRLLINHIFHDFFKSQKQ